MRRAPVIASLLVGGIAFADEPAESPQDAFGLPKKRPVDPANDPANADARDVFGLNKKQAAAADCRDGKTFGCARATDPFDPVSPMAARDWLAASYLLRLPVSDARHDNVAHFAWGASRDDVGAAFGGATGLENTWTIEGAPAENLRTGNVETRVPLTFMRGMLVTAGGFAARDRAGLGGSVDVELVRGGDDHEVVAYAWAGFTETARERPIARASYQLRRIGVAVGPEVAFSSVATGPLPKLAGGRTWYAAGVAGNIGTTDFSWRAAGLVDVDGDGIPDGLPDLVDLAPIADTAETTVDYLIPAMARAGWQRGHHEVALTLLGNFSRDAFFLANSTLQAAGIDRSAIVGDAIATWKGSWRDSRARVQLAWHRSQRRETAHSSAAAGQPQFLSAYVPDQLVEDPALAAACSDGTGDVFPEIPNCPIPFGFFASGGAGQLVDTVGDRPTITAEVAHRKGNHVVRAGGTFEDTRLVQTSRYTGGELVRSLLPGHTDTARFLAPGGECMDVAGAPCDTANEFALAYRTRYSAAYVEDTFSPIPNLQVNGGVRWELMWVGPRLHLSNEIAPRLGIAWDVLESVTPGVKDRTSRLWASMGRTHAILPAGLGQTVIARNRIVRDVVFGEVRDRNLDFGNVASVCHVDTPERCDGIEPATQDEIALGFEVGFLKALHAGVWAQHRSLRHGLETVLANPTGEVYFDNPGRDGTIEAIRETTVLAAELMIAPSPKMSVRATYLWGRTLGTWVGPFDPRQGAILYNGIDWDLDATNLYGHLPTDPGHRVAIEGERRGKLGSVEVAVATRLVVTSGRPRDVLGDSNELGVIQLLPRGSTDRMPVLAQANARVAARWRGIDFMLDVFNVFDRRDVTATNEFYAGQAIHPISGGSFEDLVWLKSESCGEFTCTATSPVRRSGYGLPTSFQNPRSFVLGVRKTF